MSHHVIGNQEQENAGALSRAGYFSELFCSVQGEGLFVGERHIFVRTAGCVATCSWCDTVYSKVQTPRFVIHPGTHGEAKPWRPNPVALDDVVGAIRIERSHPLPSGTVLRTLPRLGQTRADEERVHPFFSAPASLAFALPSPA